MWTLHLTHSGNQIRKFSVSEGKGVTAATAPQQPVSRSSLCPQSPVPFTHGHVEQKAVGGRLVSAPEEKENDRLTSVPATVTKGSQRSLFNGDDGGFTFCPDSQTLAPWPRAGRCWEGGSGGTASAHLVSGIKTLEPHFLNDSPGPLNTWFSFLLPFSAVLSESICLPRATPS